MLVTLQADLGLLCVLIGPCSNTGAILTGNATLQGSGLIQLSRHHKKTYSGITPNLLYHNSDVLPTRSEAELPKQNCGGVDHGSGPGSLL